MLTRYEKGNSFNLQRNGGTDSRMNEKKQKARECPWCGKIAEVEVKLLKKTYGDVVERRCLSCGKILAAYLEGEGEFLPKIRSF